MLVAESAQWEVASRVVLNIDGNAWSGLEE